MKRWVTQVVLHCYPKRWRDRYGTEFAALIDEETLGATSFLDILRSAFRERLRSCQTLGDEVMSMRISRRRILLFTVPILILIGNAQFAYASYRHANVAHVEAGRAARAGNADAMRFWTAMEAEEGGEYGDSIHFGIGFTGLLLIIGLVSWSRRNRDSHYA